MATLHGIFPYPRASIARAEAYYALFNLVYVYFGLNISLLRPGKFDWKPLAMLRREITPINYEALFRGRKWRDRYLRKHFARVVREKKTVLASWGGYWDFFVPVLQKGRCVAYLWSGQFSRTIPDRAAIEAQWREYSQREPRALDPQFYEYAKVALKTMVLHEEALKGYQELLELLAEWIAEERDPVWICDRADTLRKGVVSSSLLNKRWLPSVIRKERLQWVPWNDDIPKWVKEEIRIHRTPTHAMIVTTWNRAIQGEDAVDRLIREHHLRHSIFLSARDHPETYGGDYEGNAVLLTSPDPAKNGVHARLEIRERAEKVQAWVEKTFGTRAFMGVGTRHTIEDIHLSYFEAMSALNLALERKEAVVMYSGKAPSESTSRFGELHHLSRRLADAFDRQAATMIETMSARYAAAAVAQSRMRPEAVQMHLLDTYYELLDRVRRRQVADDRIIEEHAAFAAHRLEESRSIRESLDVFRWSLTELVALQQHPLEGRRELRMKRALKYVEARISGTIRLDEAADVAGYSVSAFTRAFKSMTGQNFPDYVRRLRIEKSKALLVEGGLPLAPLAQECGFSSTAYFIHVFKKIAGVTPAKYREHHR